jgi:hypothetical protein
MGEFAEDRNRKRFLQTATTRGTKTATGSMSVIEILQQPRQLNISNVKWPAFRRRIFTWQRFDSLAFLSMHGRC